MAYVMCICIHQVYVTMQPKATMLLVWAYVSDVTVFVLFW